MSVDDEIVRCDVADCIAPAVRVIYSNHGETSRPIRLCATHDLFYSSERGEDR